MQYQTHVKKLHELYSTKRTLRNYMNKMWQGNSKRSLDVWRVNCSKHLNKRYYVVKKKRKKEVIWIMQYKTHVMKLYILYSTKHTLRSYMTWIMQYQTHVKKLYALYSTKHTLRSYMRWLMQCHAHVKKH